MTPVEKAKYLHSKHSLTVLSKIGHKLLMNEVREIGKGCALIEVDDILNEFILDDSEYSNERCKYFILVKQEIENL